MPTNFSMDFSLDFPENSSDSSITSWDTSSNSKPSRPHRTVWEVLLFRPKYDVDEIVQPEKSKLRQHDPESKFYGHHPWSYVYYERHQAVKKPLPAPRWKSHSNPQALYEELARMVFRMDDLKGDRFQMEHYWNWQEVVDLRDREHRERSARHYTNAEAKALRRMKKNHFPENIKVFHTRLHKVLLYSATDVVFRGYTHEIPILVHSCVKEILDRGSYEPTLFRALPSDSYDDLVDAFNEGPSFGDGFNLSCERMQDVVALLGNFIENMKDPLVPVGLVDALFHWCVEPTCRREHAARIAHELNDTAERRSKLKNKDKFIIIPKEEWTVNLTDKPVIWDQDARALHDDWEEKQFPVAVSLLKFIPAAHLSLLAFLMDFFVKIVATIHNHMQAIQVARMFGYAIVGGPSKPVAQVIFLWLLDRWPRLADFVFLSPSKSMVRTSKVPCDEAMILGAKSSGLEAGISKLNVSAIESPKPSDECKRPTMSRASTASFYPDEDDKNPSPQDAQPPIPIIEGMSSGKAPEDQNDAVKLLYTLMLEERARTARLERKLSAREREMKKQFAARERELRMQSALLGNGSPVSEVAKGDDLGEQRAATFGKKILALLNTTTELQTSSG